MTFLYYRPSGRLPPSAIPYVSLCLIAVIPSACAYAWATSRAPALLIPLLAFVFSVWLAILVKITVARGKVRNPRWMGGIAAGIALFAWYSHWAAWISIAILDGTSPAGAVSVSETFVTMMAHPTTMAMLATNLSKVGTSGLAGGFVAALWLTELCVHLFFPYRAARIRAGAPFCEVTDTWAQKIEVAIQFEFIHDPEAIRHTLESDPAQVVCALVPCRADAASRFSELTLYACRSAGCFATIKNFIVITPDEVPVPAIRNLTATFPDKVECVNEVDEPVVELLWLPGADADELMRHWNDALDVVCS